LMGKGSYTPPRGPLFPLGLGAFTEWVAFIVNGVKDIIQWTIGERWAALWSGACPKCRRASACCFYGDGAFGFSLLPSWKKEATNVTKNLSHWWHHLLYILIPKVDESRECLKSSRKTSINSPCCTS
jgi:hypothetical protein